MVRNRSATAAGLAACVGVAVIAVSAGCNASTVSAAQAPTAQVFTLRSVGGRDLPFVAARVGDRTTELASDTLTLRADGSYMSRTTIREGVVGTGGSLTTRTEESTGQYTRSTAGVVLTRRAGLAATFDVLENGTVLRGPGPPTDAPGTSVLEVHVYRVVTGGP